MNSRPLENDVHANAGEMPARPITILIAALGGEGGGTLADWLVDAARDCGFPVQSTSIPGVSQRTGGTTYYLEIYPVPVAQLNGRMPVMALAPTPGCVDVVAATELVEAGRALQNGYIDRERTTLVASVHRIYTVAEKTVPGDGRAAAEPVQVALRANARQALLFDMAQLALAHKSRINAVLFGALVGSGVLPLERAACELAIRNAGKGAEANLRGFAAGHKRATDGADVIDQVVAAAAAKEPVARVRRKFPAQVFAVLDAGINRLTDYQDQAYAGLYIDRLEAILAVDREGGGDLDGFKLTCETARQLALWMSYEDPIRVADLKTRTSRFERVRLEVGAKPSDVVTVTDYLKPGLDEVCSMLSPRLAQRLSAWAVRNKREAWFSRPLHVKTSTVLGFLSLRAVSLLRRWRRSTSRYKEEQALIERWLGAIKRLGFAVQDVALAMEIAECARLVRGYGSTRHEGVKQFKKIFDTIIESGSETNPKKLTEAIRRARIAALADPDAPNAGSKSTDGVEGKPLIWMPRLKSSEPPKSDLLDAWEASLAKADGKGT